MATILEGLNAISQAVGGAGEAESNLEALNQISEALGGSADATENAVAIANIAENASGGGGSSDFSTARVTVTWDVGVLASEHLIYIGTYGEVESLSYNISKPNSGQSVVEVVLYKGLLIFAPDYYFVKDMSGSITFDEDNSYYRITGDCSFTLSETE